MGTYGTYMQIESHVYSSIMHSHPSREGTPHIPREPVTFRHTYYRLDSLTQAFPELPSTSQGSGVKDGCGYYPLSGPDPSIQQQLRGEEDEGLPVEAPFISLSSPYALPPFSSPAMQVLSRPVPHPLSNLVNWGTIRMENAEVRVLS